MEVEVELELELELELGVEAKVNVSHCWPGLRRVLLFAFLALGLQQLVGAGLIQAKALLAPVLIDSAWERTIAQVGSIHRPWPWADTWPVARLRLPAHAVELPILQGDSGNVLAFAPGRALASAPIGTPGVIVIGGHRDTHFSVLQHVEKGEILQIQMLAGEWRDYQVSELRIVNASQEFLPSAFGQEQLLLVTCYPFNTLRAGGPLRYVVVALPVQTRIASR
jgi:sortase A